MKFKCKYCFRMECDIANLALDKLKSALNVNSMEELDKALKILDSFLNSTGSRRETKNKDQVVIDLELLLEFINDGFDFYVTERQIDALCGKEPAMIFSGLDPKKNNEKLKKQLAIKEFKQIVYKTLRNKLKALLSNKDELKLYCISLNRGLKQEKINNYEKTVEEKKNKFTTEKSVVSQEEMFLVREIIDHFKIWLPNYNGEVDKKQLEQECNHIFSVTEMIKFIEDKSLSFFLKYISNKDTVEAITQYKNTAFLAFLIKKNTSVLQIVLEISKINLHAFSLETIHNLANILLDKNQIKNEHYDELMRSITPTRIAKKYLLIKNYEKALSWFMKGNQEDSEIQKKILECYKHIMDKEIFRLGQGRYLNYQKFSFKEFIHKETPEEEEAVCETETETETEGEPDPSDTLFLKSIKPDQFFKDDFMLDNNLQKRKKEVEGFKDWHKCFKHSKEILDKKFFEPKERMKNLIDLTRKFLLILNVLSEGDDNIGQEDNNINWFIFFVKKNDGLDCASMILTVIEQFKNSLKEYIENKNKVTSMMRRDVFMIYYIVFFMFRKHKFGKEQEDLAMQEALQQLLGIKEKECENYDHANIAAILVYMASHKYVFSSLHALECLNTAIEYVDKMIINTTEQLSKDNYLTLKALYCLYYFDCLPRHDKFLYSRIKEALKIGLKSINEVVHKNSDDYILMFRIEHALLSLLRKSKNREEKVIKLHLDNLRKNINKIVCVNLDIRIELIECYTKIIVDAIKSGENKSLKNLYDEIVIIINKHSAITDDEWLKIFNCCENVLMLVKNSIIEGKNCSNQSVAVFCLYLNNFLKSLMKVGKVVDYYDFVQSIIRYFNIIINLQKEQKKEQKKECCKGFSTIKYDFEYAKINHNEIIFTVARYNMGSFVKYCKFNRKMGDDLKLEIKKLFNDLNNITFMKEHSMAVPKKNINEILCGDKETFLKKENMEKIDSQLKEIRKICDKLYCYNKNMDAVIGKINSLSERIVALQNTIMLIPPHDFNPNYRDENNQTPLIIAIQNDAVEVICWLLEIEADPSLKDDNHKNAYQYLIDKLVKNSKSRMLNPFLNSEKINLLLRMIILCSNQNPSLSGVAIRIINGSKIINIDFQGFCDKNTWLHCAAMAGNEKLVLFLLYKGADSRLKNAKNKTWLAIAKKKKTLNALRSAISIYRLIIKLNKNNIKKIPNLQAFKNFLKKQPNLDMKHGPRKETVLHAAYRFGYDNLVDLLLQNGANNSIKDKNGKTPSEVAKNNESDVVKNSELRSIVNSGMSPT